MIEKVKSRIRKLMNLAENDAAAEGEIENALRFAKKLMDEHHLTDADINLEQNKEIEFSLLKVFTDSSKSCYWEEQLFMFITKLVGTIGVYQSYDELKKNDHGFVDLSKKGKVKVYAFYGPTEDVEIAKELWYVLQHTIAVMSVAKYGSVYRGDGRIYCEGFVSGLRSKIIKHLPTEEGSTQLSLILNSKKKQSKRWLQNKQNIQTYKPTKTFSRNVSYNPDIHRDGFEDGQKTEVSASRRKKLT